MKKLYVIFLLIAGICASATVRYVKPTASGTRDGSSWANASGDLQAMINASAAGDEVWVAAGTYTASGSFSMKEGVKIYGGFAGGETTLAARNWKTNVTTLTQKGSNSVINNNNNGLTAAAVLDGFTITGGNNPQAGGGMYNAGSSPAITNVIFNENITNGFGGGGMANRYSSSPTLTNVMFTANRANNPSGTGGGIYNYYYSSPTITNATFSGNSSSKPGSGIYNEYGSNPVINNTIVLGNGISNSASNPAITYSLIEGMGADANNHNLNGNFSTADVFETTNSADANYLRLKAGSPAIDKGLNSANTTPADLAGNRRIANGTIDLGAYEYGSTPYYLPVRYVTQTGAGSQDGSSWANASNDLQAMINASAATNQVWVAAGTYKPNRRADATGTITANDLHNSFVLTKDVKIYGGFAGTETTLNARNWKTNVTTLSGDLGTVGNTSDNAYHVVVSSGDVGAAALDGFTLSGGNARGGGNNFITVNSNYIVDGMGAGMYNINSSPAITNCVFTGNSAVVGGGIYNYSSSPPVITNSVFAGNSAQDIGGGIYDDDSSSGMVTNCTFYANSPTGMDSDSGLLTVQNSIVEDSLYGYNFAFSYSLVSGRADTSNGNLDGTAAANSAANVFASTTATDANYLRLKPTSPVLNKGNNAVNTTTLDLDGNPRIYNNGIIDLGAYELQAPPQTLGTAEAFAPAKASVYPNPAHEEVYVEAAAKGTLGIYDLSGKLIKTAALQSGKNTVDIAALPSAVYIFRIATEAGVQTQKVIKD